MEQQYLERFNKYAEVKIRTKTKVRAKNTRVSVFLQKPRSEKWPGNIPVANQKGRP